MELESVFTKLKAALTATRWPTTWFVHERLPSVTSWIRVVQVLPSTEYPIRCFIRSTRLDASRYACLSYQWGDEEPEHRMRRIVVNGKWFRVRENLWHFLDVARKVYASTDFWIDAICIDQSNPAERNAQVANMGDIFRARSVIAWLGRDLPTCELGDELEQELERVTQTSTDRAWLKQEFRILFNMSNNCYWRRAWVVQELSLAHNVVVVCGMTAYPFDKIQEAYSECLNSFKKLQRRGRAPASDTNCIYTLEKLCTTLVSTRHQLRLGSFPAVVKQFKMMECSELHDRIYSLRSLDPEGSKIRVDYRVSKGDLFLRSLAGPKGSFCLCFVTDLLQMLEIGTERVHTTHGLNLKRTIITHNEVLRLYSSPLPPPHEVFLLTQFRLSKECGEAVWNMWETRHLLQGGDVPKDSVNQQDELDGIWLSLEDMCSNLRGQLFLQLSKHCEINVFLERDSPTPLPAVKIGIVWSVKQNFLLRIAFAISTLGFLADAAYIDRSNKCNKVNSLLEAETASLEALGIFSGAGKE